MGDLLKNWIETTVKNELNEGLTWLEHKSAKSSINESSLLEDDGSNLRIKVTKLSGNNVVQIVKFTAFEEPEPIQAEVSDSFTRVKVTFAASAVEKFTLKEQKRITRDTLGVLIQIIDFEIVATHIGPRASRLTILIKEFITVGSEGSGTFGIPRPIDNIEGILELLDKLKSFRENESSICQEQKNEDLSARSSTVELLDGNTSSPGFATQVFRSRHTSRISVNGTKSSDKAFQTAPDKPPKQAVYAKARIETLEKSRPDSKESPEILQNMNSGVRLQSPKRSPAKPRKAVNENRNIKADELLSLLPSNPRPKRLVPSRLAAISIVSMPAAILVNQAQTEVSETVTSNAENNQGVNAVENAVSSLQNSKKPADEAQVMIASDVGVLDVPSASTINKATSSTFSPPPGRIKDREVKILKDQKTLLERSDGWIPAEPGQREPVANIPIKTLQMISERAESRQRHFSKPSQFDQPRNQNGSQASRPTTEREADSSEGSEPDVPIPSEEWPPSSPPQPIREQLPPDSSAVAPTQIDSFREGEISKDEPTPKKRKMSSTSASSNSVTPSRKGSIRGSDASKSSIRSSPVSASDSVEKGPGSFNRPISEREQPYLKSQELQYHMKRNRHKMNLRAEDSDNPKSKTSTANGNVCARCHKHFDLPRDLFQHDKNSRCVADSNENLQSLVDTNSSPIFAKTNQALTQTPKEDIRELPNNDIALQPTESESEIKEYSSSPDLSVTQHEAHVEDPVQDSNEVFGLLRRNSIQSASSETPNASNVSHINTTVITESDSTKFNADLEKLKTITEPTDLSKKNVPMRKFPSTAPQPEEPVLQVKRTPYINGNASGIISMDHVSQVSPSTTKCVSVKTIVNGANVYQIATKPLMPDINDDEALLAKHADNLSPRKRNDDVSSESPRSMDLDLIDQQVQDAINTQTRSTFMDPLEQQNQDTTDTRSLGSQTRSLVEEHDSIEVENTLLREQESSCISITESAPLSFSNRDLVMIKRKRPEAAAHFPHVTKRRKRSQRKFSFNFSQDPYYMPDPSVLGSRHRQDFFNSRKQSMTGIENEQIADSSSQVATLTPSSCAKSEDDKAPILESEHDMSPVILRPSSLDLQHDEELEKDSSDSQMVNHHFGTMPCDVTPIKIESSYEEEAPQKAGQTVSHKLSNVLMTDITTYDVGMAQVQNESLPLTKPMNYSTRNLNIFDHFKIAYPSYTATLKQFIAICKRIDNLVKADRMEHQSLWDDFIIRHKTEYSNYLRRCVDAAEDPAPYERFYRNEIDEAQFISRIITRKTLHEALALGNKKKNRTGQPPNQQLMDVQETENTLGGLQTTKVGNGSKRLAIEQPSLHRAVVDLTSDNEEPSVKKEGSPLFSENKSPRSLPWLKMQECGIFEERKKSSSTKSIPKALSSSRLPEVANRISTKALKSRYSSSITPTPAKKQAPRLSSIEFKGEGAKTTQVLDLKTGRADPQILEGSQSDAIAGTPNQSMETSRETGTNISSHTSLSTKDRTEGDRENERFSNDRNPEEEFLPSESPSSAKFEQEISAKPWWKDHHTPFTNFTRSYAAIRRGNGNSYAIVDSSKPEGKEELSSVATPTPNLKRIDILKWRL